MANTPDRVLRSNYQERFARVICLLPRQTANPGSVVKHFRPSFVIPDEMTALIQVAHRQYRMP